MLLVTKLWILRGGAFCCVKIFSVREIIFVAMALFSANNLFLSFLRLKKYRSISQSWSVFSLFICLGGEMYALINGAINHNQFGLHNSSLSNADIRLSQMAFVRVSELSTRVMNLITSVEVRHGYFCI